MALSPAQLARNRIAHLISARAPADQIEQARADLEYINARAAVSSWSLINLERRAQLVTLLLSGASNGR